MSKLEMGRIVRCGREITVEELAHIRGTVELFPDLDRRELANTLCEHLRWYTAAGGTKVDACLKLLEKLEAEGTVKLAPKREQGRHGQPCRQPERTPRTDPAPEVSGTLADVAPVWLEVAGRGEAAGLWNEYVDRYHYLGYRRPFGFPLRYLVRSEAGVLGCVLVAGAAKSIGVRDRWIGWTEEQRLRNLAWVVNNTRFLILPWVRVRYLASHVLGIMARRIAEDFSERWGYQPVLMETFVDPERYQGTCYRAAGWRELGQTTGEGLRRRNREYSTTPKIIFVRPLMKDFREQLCSEKLRGRVEE